MSEFINGDFRYVTVHGTAIDAFGVTAARLIGFFRNRCKSIKADSSKMTNHYIEECSRVHHANQRKYTKILQEYKFLKIKRSRKNFNSEYIWYDTNYILFIMNPETYLSSVENDTLGYIESSLEFDEYKDMEKIERLVQNCIKDKLYDVSAILKNIQSLETVGVKIPEDNSFNLKQAITDEPAPKEAPSKITRRKINNKNKEQNITCSTQNESKIHSTTSPRPQLNRRKKSAIVRNAPPINRRELKDNPKIESLKKFANSRSYFQIKQHWNSFPCLRKLSEHTGKENKSLFRSILAVQALLSGRLFKTGITMPSGAKDFLEMPRDFVFEEKVTVDWVKERINLLVEIIQDHSLVPTNKTFLRKLTLGDFILGSGYGSSRVPSVMFSHCLGELKVAWKDPNEEETEFLIRQYRLYSEREDSISGKDRKGLSELASKLIKMAGSPDVKRSHSLGKGRIKPFISNYVSILERNWRGDFNEANPSYLYSNTAWSIFESKLEY